MLLAGMMLLRYSEMPPKLDLKVMFSICAQNPLSLCNQLAWSEARNCYAVTR